MRGAIAPHAEPSIYEAIVLKIVFVISSKVATQE